MPQPGGKQAAHVHCPCGFVSLGSAVVVYDRLFCRTSRSGFFEQGCIVRASRCRDSMASDPVSGPLRIQGGAGQHAGAPGDERSAVGWHSSVVEHSLGKGEVESSILSASSRFKASKRAIRAATQQSAVTLTNWLLITPPSPPRGYFWNKWIGFSRLRCLRTAKVVISKSLLLESSKHSSYG